MESGETIILPHDQETEEIVLASILNDPIGSEEYISSEPEGLFYNTPNRILWRCFKGLSKEGTPLSENIP